LIISSGRILGGRGHLRLNISGKIRIISFFGGGYGMGEVVGRIKVFGVAGVERIYRSSISGVRFFVESVGNIKVQSKSCISQRVSWKHFGTWQDWTIATNGKWYYNKC
jgi:hypothetical protein